MIKAFLKYGHLLKEVNQDQLTLIPRKENQKKYQKDKFVFVICP